jgi:hypothetical protein
MMLTFFSVATFGSASILSQTVSAELSIGQTIAGILIGTVIGAIGIILPVGAAWSAVNDYLREDDIPTGLEEFWG